MFCLVLSLSKQLLAPTHPHRERERANNDDWWGVDSNNLSVCYVHIWWGCWKQTHVRDFAWDIQIHGREKKVSLTLLAHVWWLHCLKQAQKNKKNSLIKARETVSFNVVVSLSKAFFSLIEPVGSAATQLTKALHTIHFTLFVYPPVWMRNLIFTYIENSKWWDCETIVLNFID